ncbi:MAG: methyltransferase domain-containing protein [Desulfarculaceae bacterium]|nr:methyltransferase domain-containing protein [Desulfarculaceae bacterium]MCF8072364.1 methyltransferase domain-containing protein [Desulfarculaceae bacterium]MCF8100285.1 methyltransferase domain-containing protein [Desulfarculaceae bacterium]MCF8116142.1 methyltransferase domain-containing protein [Desulfarculaceae bacterium]
MNQKEISQEEFIEALCNLHKGLPRGGPGSDDYTRQALSRLKGLPASPRVLDLGCGPGKQTLVLAEELGVPIKAVDFYRPFLDTLEADAQERGLAELVRAELGDMLQLEYAPASWDLIWCEGAIFIPGFANGLKMWRPWLAPGGYVAVTECSWLKPNPPQEVAQFWEQLYPEIGQIQDCLGVIRSAGYEVVDHFTMAPSAWWDNYIGPLSAHMDELAKTGGIDPAMELVMEQCRHETDIYRKYHEWYGYVFYLMRAK